MWAGIMLLYVKPDDDTSAGRKGPYAASLSPCLFCVQTNRQRVEREGALTRQQSARWPTAMLVMRLRTAENYTIPQIPSFVHRSKQGSFRPWKDFNHTFKISIKTVSSPGPILSLLMGQRKLLIFLRWPTALLAWPYTFDDGMEPATHGSVSCSNIMIHI